MMQTYKTVHSSKIQKEQVTKVEQVLVQICKEEQNKNSSKAAAMEETGGGSIAFAAIKPAVSPLQGAHANCNYCHKTGHDMENCFQLVGYPDWCPKLAELLLLQSDVLAEPTLVTGVMDAVVNNKVAIVASVSQPQGGQAYVVTVAGKEEGAVTFENSSLPFPRFIAEQW